MCVAADAVECRRKERAVQRIQARQKGIAARALARQEKERQRKAKVQHARCGAESQRSWRLSVHARWLLRFAR